ncbi:MAG TPA: hypothetical protein DEG17_05590 [Cyanobacteria bacterium UBA11149]|nr:hypothetical protein [Cyanobacteria bacterium UBA11367]HBE57236.1 hypothetical protein [Cyanobacteria bacterium UBA11366]HBK65657.1 hypothetical protein [Cyanobacteria bacterium UBA11166]HBS71324.1 hypothetical protein [Cyanobacteria bacterium UBA11153]HBW88351.1 hypothetical protein [Cyanobacteria bacterium UBA11149]HCA97190.1 hypothetical protein [Cyanobacteria bacterium UBA9226]
MYNQFIASQSVELAVPKQPIPIQHYLRQPQRLVYAIAERNQIQQLNPDLFLLKMRPLNFLSLNFQPIVKLRVWADGNGMVNLASVDCEIIGLDYINQRFSLNLNGKLYPTYHNGVTRLIGRADLKVGVDVPFPLSLTPSPILETTGNGLLKSILLRIKQKLMHQLLLDYSQWASTDSQNRSIASTASATTPFPL